MDIYKLSDEIPEKRRIAIREGGNDFGGELRITELKSGVKNPNRVNVYINGKYVLSLDVAQVVDLGVKVGQVISAERLGELRKASEYGKEYQRALEWVLMRPRSERELRDYLRRRSRQSEVKEKKQEWERERAVAELIAKGEDVEAKKLAKKDARIKKSLEEREKYDFEDLIVRRLCDKGYVDDVKFAEFWVENRFVKKGVSRRRLEQELKAKGVAEDVISGVLGGRNDEDEIRKIITKKRARYNDEKLMAYLCRQGFSYDLVRRMVVEDGD